MVSRTPSICWCKAVSDVLQQAPSSVSWAQGWITSNCSHYGMIQYNDCWGYKTWMASCWTAANSFRQYLQNVWHDIRNISIYFSISIIPQATYESFTGLCVIFFYMLLWWNPIENIEILLRNYGTFGKF